MVGKRLDCIPQTLRKKYSYICRGEEGNPSTSLVNEAPQEKGLHTSQTPSWPPPHFAIHLPDKSSSVKSPNKIFRFLGCGLIFLFLRNLQPPLKKAQDFFRAKGAYPSPNFPLLKNISRLPAADPLTLRILLEGTTRPHSLRIQSADPACRLMKNNQSHSFKKTLTGGHKIHFSHNL